MQWPRHLQEIQLQIWLSFSLLHLSKPLYTRIGRHRVQWCESLPETQGISSGWLEYGPMDPTRTDNVISCQIPSQWQLPCFPRANILCWIPWWILTGKTASVSPAHQRDHLSWCSSTSSDWESSKIRYIKRGWRTYWEKRNGRVQSYWQ